jgi:hypothetical protein
VANNRATLLTHLQQESRIDSSNRGPTSYEFAHYNVKKSTTYNHPLMIWRWHDVVALARFLVELWTACREHLFLHSLTHIDAAQNRNSTRPSRGWLPRTRARLSSSLTAQVLLENNAWSIVTESTLKNFGINLEWNLLRCLRYSNSAQRK